MLKKLSNTTGSAQSAINFETGLADNPHVTLHISGREASLVPGAGVSVFEDNSQTTGLQPEIANPGQPVCLEKFKASSRTYDEELTSGLCPSTEDSSSAPRTPSPSTTARTLPNISPADSSRASAPRRQRQS